MIIRRCHETGMGDPLTSAPVLLWFYINQLGLFFDIIVIASYFVCFRLKCKRNLWWNMRRVRSASPFRWIDLCKWKGVTHQHPQVLFQHLWCNSGGWYLAMKLLIQWCRVWREKIDCWWKLATIKQEVEEEQEEVKNTKKLRGENSEQMCSVKKWRTEEKGHKSQMAFGRQDFFLKRTNRTLNRKSFLSCPKESEISEGKQECKVQETDDPSLNEKLVIWAANSTPRHYGTVNRHIDKMCSCSTLELTSKWGLFLW